MRKFKVVYEREPDGWWIVSVPQVPGVRTQGRTIEQARRRIREALATAIGDKSTAAAELIEDVRLPADCFKDVRAVIELREQMEATRIQLAKIEQRAVRKLRQDARLGQRDAGEILGVSFQRFHQLEKR